MLKKIITCFFAVIFAFVTSISPFASAFAFDDLVDSELQSESLLNANVDFISPVPDNSQINQIVDIDYSNLDLPINFDAGETVADYCYLDENNKLCDYPLKQSKFGIVIQGGNAIVPISQIVVSKAQNVILSLALAISQCALAEYAWTALKNIITDTMMQNAFNKEYHRLASEMDYEDFILKQYNDIVQCSDGSVIDLSKLSEGTVDIIIGLLDDVQSQQLVKNSSFSNEVVSDYVSPQFNSSYSRDLVFNNGFGNMPYKRHSVTTVENSYLKRYGFNGVCNLSIPSSCSISHQESNLQYGVLFRDFDFLKGNIPATYNNTEVYRDFTPAFGFLDKFNTSSQSYSYYVYSASYIERFKQITGYDFTITKYLATDCLNTNGYVKNNVPFITNAQQFSQVGAPFIIDNGSVSKRLESSYLDAISYAKKLLSDVPLEIGDCLLVNGSNPVSWYTGVSNSYTFSENFIILNSSVNNQSLILPQFQFVYLHDTYRYYGQRELAAADKPWENAPISCATLKPSPLTDGSTSYKMHYLSSNHCSTEFNIINQNGTMPLIFGSTLASISGIEFNHVDYSNTSLIGSDNVELTDGNITNKGTISNITSDSFSPDNINNLNDSLGHIVAKNWHDSLSYTDNIINRHTAEERAIHEAITNNQIRVSNGSTYPNGESIKPNTPPTVIKPPISPVIPNFGSPSASFALNKFPFCIPSALYLVVGSFSATPEAPQFYFPIATPVGTYNIDVDLSSFDSVAVVCRSMTAVLLFIGLIFTCIKLLTLLRVAGGE